MNSINKPNYALINLLKMNNFNEMNCISSVSIVNNETNPDLVWSEIGKVWMSKIEFAKDDEEMWSDIEDEYSAQEDSAQEDSAQEDDDSFDCFPSKSRRRQSWQDIAIASSLASRRRLEEKVKEEEKEEKEETPECNECTSECAICYDCFTTTDACSTTPCGHKFHSKCLFQNFEHRPECPLCRTELIKQPEEDDDDDDDESSYYSEEEDEEPVIKQVASMKQMADKLASLGYTMEDLLMLHFGGSDHPKDIANPRWANDLNPDENGSTTTTNSTISLVGSHIKQYDVYEKIYKEPNSMLEKLSADIENIVEGNLGVDYKDTRTYAQVLASSTINQ
jgi:hypothetical protein